MKKIIIILIILLLTGGCIFYFGWIQILLPPETYAVIFTKMGGYDSHVTEPGVFTWRWERLIPTNMTVFKFDLKPYTSEVSYKTTLPSGELYASILPENPDFDFEAAVAVEFRLKPESLPDMVANDKLKPETLSEYYEKTAKALTPKIMELSLQRDKQGSQGSVLPDIKWDKRLITKLEEFYPDIEVLSLHTRVLKIPDLELYMLAKESYLKLLKTREDSMNTVAAQLAVEQERAKAQVQSERARLKLISEYGELFTKYPVLLKLYYIQKASGAEGLDIPELKDLKILEESE